MSTTFGNLLEISVDSVGDEVVLLLTGEVDLVTAWTLHEALVMALQLVPGGRVVVDMAGISFFDSGGTHSLTRAAGVTSHFRTRIIVRNPRPLDRKVFGIVGLDSVVTIEPDNQLSP